MELKHFTTKPAKIWGGAECIEKVSSKIWGGGGRPPCPPGSGPHDVRPKSIIIEAKGHEEFELEMASGLRS